MLQLHTMKMRLILIIIGVSFITMIGIGGFFIYHVIEDNETLLADYREDLTKACENKLVSETETAVSVINEYYKKQQRGELTEEQAKKMAADEVRELRYDKGVGYFWIDTYCIVGSQH